MAIDRHEDDSPAFAAGANETERGRHEARGCVADRIDAEKFASDEIPGADGGHGSLPASDESSELGYGLVDGADRVAYHLRYRETVDAEIRAAAHDRWEAAKVGFAAEWGEYSRCHPAPAEVSPALDDAVASEVKTGCDRIGETEENIVTPVMLGIEAADPERHLVGLEHRRKGQDRIMEKVANWMAAQPELTAEEALAMVKDPIRYTLQYSEDHYSGGVHADVERLKAAGFDLVELRNSWASEGYKGINSRWRVPESGQLFEVQFHTQISFEAKQLTHPAYERLRSSLAQEAEQDVVVNFQRQVNAYVPEPQRAHEIPNVP